MEWARSNTVRAVAVTALAALIVVKASAGDWAWVLIGAVLLLFNLILWRSYRAEQRGRSSAGVLPPPYGQVPQPGPGPSGPEVDHPVDLLLSELLDRPAVAVALNEGPEVWRQVSYLEDPGLDLPAAEVASYVWILAHNDEIARIKAAHWSIGLGEEMKPLLDLDVDEDGDPLIATLMSHPSVVEAVHSDREEYDVTLRAPMTLEEMAALAVRGLIAHHLDAVRRILPGS